MRKKSGKSGVARTSRRGDRRGETLAEVLAAVVIAAMSLSMMWGAISVLRTRMWGQSERKSGENGVVIATFRLGGAEYSIDVDVVYAEEGYLYEE